MSRRFHVLFAVAALTAASVPLVAYADLVEVGEGKNRELAESQFQGDHLKQYRLFRERCTKCHEMSRPIAALKTGITPVSGDTFDEQGIKKYVLKMMRKPNSGIQKSDARELVDFLRHARKMATAGGQQ